MANVNMSGMDCVVVGSFHYKRDFIVLLLFKISMGKLMIFFFITIVKI